MSFWDIVWFIVISFAFVAYLMVLFSIITDMFRDREMGGWAKALWIIFLIFMPFLSMLIYLVARGRGMAERSATAAEEARAAQETYIKQVAGGNGSPTDEIARAKALLDAHAISQSEYEALKTKALQKAS
jgi:hypothetical protein